MGRSGEADSASASVTDRQIGNSNYFVSYFFTPTSFVLLLVYLRKWLLKASIGGGLLGGLFTFQLLAAQPVPLAQPQRITDQ